MCVIAIVDNEKQRPDAWMVEKMWATNPDGGGVAYRKDKKVVWHKGIMGLDEMIDVVAKIPTPFVAHFRIASKNGGGVRANLTHPFPVAKNAPLNLKGETDGYVLFHNGDWSGWNDVALQAGIANKAQFPRGKFSDTRAMAWLISMHGLGFMEMLPNQRGVAFGPTDMEVFTGPGWTKVNDMWCSNDHFMTKYNNLSPMCRAAVCQNRVGLDTAGYCPMHTTKPVPTTIHLAPTQGVSEARPNPFRQTAPGGLISLETAELIHKQDRSKLSKNLLKKIRKAYGWLEGGSEKQRLAARLQLSEISEDLMLIRH